MLVVLIFPLLASGKQYIVIIFLTYVVWGLGPHIELQSSSQHFPLQNVNWWTTVFRTYLLFCSLTWCRVVWWQKFSSIFHKEFISIGNLVTLSQVPPPLIYCTDPMVQNFSGGHFGFAEAMSGILYDGATCSTCAISGTGSFCVGYVADWEEDRQHSSR